MPRSRSEAESPALRRKVRRAHKSAASEAPVLASPAGSARGRRHEVWGVLVTAAGLFFALALFSYDASGPGAGNWMGPVGAIIVRFTCL